MHDDDDEDDDSIIKNDRMQRSLSSLGAICTPSNVFPFQSHLA